MQWSKREVAGIGVLKGVKMVLCGMESINLTLDSIKILGIQFSYKNQISSEENFLKNIAKIESISKFCRMTESAIWRFS